MTTTLQSHGIKFTTLLTALILSAGFTAASPNLNGVSYDPAFISAGDRVNISANLQETQVPETDWNEDRQLRVVLKPGNRLTEQYVTIEDDRDESIGFLYPDGIWNQRYQVKLDSNAPTGRYDFELHIQYLENGEPVRIRTDSGSTVTYIEKFSMPVDSEGVDISSDVSGTEPTVPRPGDNYVEVDIDVTNTGNKPLEEIELRPTIPENIETSYSSDEKFYIDQLLEGDAQRRKLNVDLDEDLEPGLHQILMNATYEDESGNQYTETLDIPLRVEGRADLELENSTLEMKAGETSELRLKVRNTGDQDAESVTARILAERSQPFSLEDRSNYIGEIEAGETAEAVMKISSDRSASLKTHQLKVQLRSNGDSEEGDHSTYVFTENADIELSERTESNMIYFGLLGGLIVLAGLAYRMRSKKKEGGDE